MADLTVDEWRAIVEQVSEDVYDSDARTTAELAEVLGMPLGSTKDLLRAGLANGCVERCTIQRENLLGRMQRLVGFKIRRPEGAA